jgi:hypothetical protein
MFYSTGGARWHRRRRPQAQRELEHVEKPGSGGKSGSGKFMNEGLLFLLKTFCEGIKIKDVSSTSVIFT